MREISAGIIIYRQTKEGIKFLFLYHSRGYWNFPKGKIEIEERSLQTAFREVREETGLGRENLKLQDNFRVKENFIFSRMVNGKRFKVFKTVIFYLAETRVKRILIPEKKKGEPHEGYAWFSYLEAIKVLNRYKGVQRILKQANDFIKNKKRPV